jgi:hypothetical protein
MTGLDYVEVLDQFPQVQHAFAYGSAAFHQPGLYPSETSSRPMLDFILGVQDPVAWHAEVTAQRAPPLLAPRCVRASQLMHLPVGVRRTSTAIAATTHSSPGWGRAR